MESPEHQEWRARQRVSWPAIFKAGLGVGLFLFIFSGGTPWTSGGIVTGVMGRAMPWPWALIIAAHFGLCLAYMAVVAHVIYRFRVLTAIIVGLLVSFVLYLVNYAVLGGWSDHRDDGRALAAHLVFGLFASAIYKALATPRPLRTAAEAQQNSAVPRGT